MTSIGPPRVLVTRYFQFPVANAYFSVSLFLPSVNELLEFMEIWDTAISFATYLLGNRSECILVEGVIVQGPDHSGPRYADPPSVLRHWQLVLNYFRY